uniref:DIS3-like exonuclease 2 n=1 Tax=Aceria tosichella TaxID=561515 RepID=A0A6G1SHV5_9ACAR
MDNVDQSSNNSVTLNSSSGTTTLVVSESSEEFSGIIRINPRSYNDAFIDDPQGGSDIFIEGMQSRNAALEGDLVLVRLNPQSQWKTNPMKNNAVQKTGTVVKIIKRNHPCVAGGFLKPYSDTHALFSPIDSKIPRMLIDLKQCPVDFTTQPDRYKDVLFVAQIQHWNPKSKLATGNLVKIIGDSNMIESRMEILLIENQIFDVDFPQEAYKELDYLNDLPRNWFAKNSTNRRDLTNECVFTIDPKTARDLDDALSIKQVAEQIYEIGVHIADVSHFVREMSSVDYFARQRTTSVYLVNRVIPMLPRPLCEHMCSLNPDEPKLTFSVIWKMDKYGRVIDEWFGKTIIKSCVKLSYEQAQDLIDRPDNISWIEEDVNMPRLRSFDWNRISKAVITLNRIAQNMRTKRFSDGALRIDNVKIKYELDQESGLPTGFSFETRTDANYLIEEFMLKANMSVAKKIYDYSNEFAFLRRHPPSHPQVLKEVKEFCDAKGYPMDITSAGSIQKSINAISDKTTSRVVSYLLLRAMKNAEYICTGALPPSDTSYRHFALNVPFYTHFTSPIRRYADVIVHRQLALALGIENDCNEDIKTLGLMAAECTKRKISSKLISEASQKLYFNVFVQRAGFCELLACVTRIYDQCFEVILVDYNQTGRVYMDRVAKQLQDYKFENVDGIKRLVLNWKLPSKRAQKKAQKFKKLVDKHELNGTNNVVDEKLSCRKDLEKPVQGSKGKMKINEANANQQQIIQVFDVIRVIVTVDEKDISKLKIDLKLPTQVGPA